MHPPPPPGGGGDTSIIMYAYWVCVARENPIFSPEFPFRSISFSQISNNKNPFRSITILNFWADFAVPETIIFKISLISTRSSRPTACSAPFGSHSGDSHFHAQNGSSSFRSPTFSRSTGSPFRSPCPFFTLPRHIPINMWGDPPPPPPGCARYFRPIG